MQVGYKSMMYMHLHAEAVLALVECPCSEIQFRQISGDFQLLQGKFMLQDATLPEVPLSPVCCVPLACTAGERLSDIRPSRCICD